MDNKYLSNFKKPNDEGESWRVKKRNEELLNLSLEIEGVILFNLKTISERPISVRLRSSDIHIYISEIKELYPSFTIEIMPIIGTLLIKLADKEWDWHGYGIKDVKIVNDKIEKQNWFKVIANKAFCFVTKLIGGKMRD